MTELPWWFWPFLVTLILIAIHTYFGLHVISRKVLFVDLAIAQIAALGSTVAFLFGFETADPVTYGCSLVFGVIGAWVFSVTRTRDDRVPHEAIIGLAFAIASAAAILMSAENPHGAEHLRDIMAGSILVVTPAEVRTDFVIYSAVGAFHWVFRKNFLAVSLDPEGAARDGLNVQRWDFIFYLTFALIVTMSVHIAGVLLVFCLLIAPAVCGALFSSNFRVRLVIGWVTSIIAAILGLMVSSRYDWPPAPCIIAVYAAILVGAGLVGKIRGAPNKGRAMSEIALAGGALVLTAFAMVSFLRSEVAQRFRVAEPGHAEVHPEHVAPEHGLGTTASELIAGLTDEHDSVREKAAEALAALGSPEAADALEKALAIRGEDEWIRVRVADALVRSGGKRGMEALLDLAANGEARAVRTEALTVAARFANKPKAPLPELTAWWKQASDSARWDPAAGVFRD